MSIRPRNELGRISGLEVQAKTRYQDYKNRMELSAVETGQDADLFEQFEARTETQKRAILLCRMAEGQARRLGYDTADQYYRQAVELEPRSVYTLVSYGLFKAELGNHGEATELMERAAQYCTRKTGFYVYFRMAGVYNQVRDRANRIRCLRKALRYEPKHTIAKHSLGVALSQSGNFDEALKLFDEIIRDELSRTAGPTDSLAYAYNTKIITLRRAGRETEAEEAREEAMKELSKISTFSTSYAT